MAKIQKFCEKRIDSKNKDTVVVVFLLTQSLKQQPDVQVKILKKKK